MDYIQDRSIKRTPKGTVSVGSSRPVFAERLHLLQHGLRCHELVRRAEEKYLIAGL